MSCIYSDFHGKCSLFEEGQDNDLGPEGCENGVCVVEDDPNPSDSCGSFEDSDPDNEEDKYER